jgi:flagellar biosynthesis/type III secretory pathway ATPase
MYGENTNTPQRIKVGKGLLGKVVDGLGNILMILL